MEEKLTIRSPDGIKLAAVLERPANPSGAGVVICHGMMSYKDSPKHRGIAARLCDRGHTVLRFDFSGRGESEGDLLGLTFTRQVGECRAAMNFLATNGEQRIGLAGSSMGGAVSILVAARGGVSALATLAAVGRTDLLPERAVGKKGLAVWKRRGSIRIQDQRVGFCLVEDAMAIDMCSEAGKIECPWLILHGAADEVIPAEDAGFLQRSSGNRAELEIVPGADHRFSDQEHLEHATGRIVDFLDNALS
jgi:uncharacterized protein